jgi:hypothetical protein
MGCVGKLNCMGWNVAAGKTKGRELDLAEYFQRIRYSTIFRKRAAFVRHLNNIPVPGGLQRLYGLGKVI